MANEKFQKLKSRYEEVQRGLDQLQEEIVARGMQLRPGLRRQFEEALRGLFYAMAYADGRIDQREVAFYNFLFEEDLSATTFELVMGRLQHSSTTFEDDLLTAVTTFAQYDKAITGDIPLNAPSLAELLLSAAETVGNMVIAADGEVERSEALALRELIQNCKQRANLIAEGGEALLRDGSMDDDYDPDALMARDVRGVIRRLTSTLTELVIGASDIVSRSGIGQYDDRVVVHAKAASVIAESVRDNLERGDATKDQLVLAAGQIEIARACLTVVRDASDAVGNAWNDIAHEALIGFQLKTLWEECDARVRMLREKHDWHPEIDVLEQTLTSAWAEVENSVRT